MTRMRGRRVGRHAAMIITFPSILQQHISLLYNDHGSCVKVNLRGPDTQVHNGPLEIC